MKSGAIFSNDRKYRYALWRRWDIHKSHVMFIGLNPSSADEKENDPTIRRVVQFAKDWGFGGVYMLNLFSYISTNSSNIAIVGPENNFYLEEIYHRYCTEVIFAWGNFPWAKDRAIEVMKLFPEGKVLIQNKNGSPRHPLYVPANTIRYKPRPIE